MYASNVCFDMSKAAAGQNRSHNVCVRLASFVLPYREGVSGVHVGLLLTGRRGRSIGPSAWCVSCVCPLSRWRDILPHSMIPISGYCPWGRPQKGPGMGSAGVLISTKMRTYLALAAPFPTARKGRKKWGEKFLYLRYSLHTATPSKRWQCGAWVILSAQLWSAGEDGRGLRASC